MKEYEEIAKGDADDCKKLCEAAGLSEEWKAEDGENFEAVVERAAEILGSRRPKSSGLRFFEGGAR